MFFFIIQKKKTKSHIFSYQNFTMYIHDLLFSHPEKRIKFHPVFYFIYLFFLPYHKIIKDIIKYLNFYQIFNALVQI